jgi:hypothetical protein
MKIGAKVGMREKVKVKARPTMSNGARVGVFNV